MLEVEPTGRRDRTAIGGCRNGRAYRFASIGAIPC